MEVRRSKDGLSGDDVIELIQTIHQTDYKQIINAFMKDVDFPEWFLRQYIDVINLSEVFIFQNVSKDFIREFITKDTMLHVLFGNDHAKEDEKFYKEIEKRFIKP